MEVEHWGWTAWEACVFAALLTAAVIASLKAFEAFRSASWYRTAWQESLSDCHTLSDQLAQFEADFRRHEATWRESLERCPENGTHGLWEVQGLDRKCPILARSAAEAVDEAIRQGVVGAWEYPQARLVRQLPTLEVAAGLLKSHR